MKDIIGGLNIIEDETKVWQSQSPLVETQQDDQLELQITLQEVINMIDITVPEKTMATHGNLEETMATHGSPEETMADENLQWFDLGSLELRFIIKGAVVRLN